MTRLASIFIVAIFALLSACSPKVDEARLSQARGVYADLHERNYAAIEAELPQEMRNARSRAELQAMADKLPPAEARPEVKLLRWQTSDDSARTQFVHLYTYPDRVLEVTTEIGVIGGKRFLLGFWVNPIDPALIAANRFQLGDAGVAQILSLVIMALSGIAMLTAALSALFVKGLKFRWLVVPLSLVGWGAGAANWTTGAIAFNVAAVTLVRLGVTPGLSPADPWTVNFSAPVGALLVLIFLAFRAGKAERSSSRDRRAAAA